MRTPGINRICNVCGKEVGPGEKLKHILEAHKEFPLKIVDRGYGPRLWCTVCDVGLGSASHIHNHRHEQIAPASTTETDLQLSPEQVIAALRWLISDRDTAWQLAQDFRSDLEAAQRTIARLEQEMDDARISPITVKVNSDVLQRTSR